MSGSPPGGLAQGVAGGGHGEVHVRAGVAVGHGVDVEGVDLLARVGQGIGRDVDETQHDPELDRSAPGASIACLTCAYADGPADLLAG